MISIPNIYWHRIFNLQAFGWNCASGFVNQQPYVKNKALKQFSVYIVINRGHAENRLALSYTVGVNSKPFGTLTKRKMEFDNLENITKQLWGAANTRSICSLKLEGENGYRMIHTHGVFMSKQKKLTIVCWQKSGFSVQGAPEGYKKLDLERCESVLVLSRKFVKRRDFNPKDAQYGEWLFHI